LHSAYEGLTLEQAINKYAPSSENNVGRYIFEVDKWMGITKDTVIDAYIDENGLNTTPETQTVETEVANTTETPKPAEESVSKVVT